MPRKRPPSAKKRPQSVKPSTAGSTSKGAPFNASKAHTVYWDRIPHTSTGRDVRVASKSQASEADFTVRLTLPDRDYLDLWVDEVEMGFQLQGTTGQAQLYRQFYPRSFSQPQMTLRGQMPNQHEYNRLAQFVRASHLQALVVGSTVAVKGIQDLYRVNKHTNIPKSTVKLYLRPNLPKHLSARLKEDPYLHRTPWQHKGMLLEGYIPRINAGAERYNVAPQFEFTFVIASSAFSDKVGIYTDTPYLAADKIKSFLDQFGTKTYNTTPQNRPQPKKKPTPHSQAWRWGFKWGRGLGGFFG